MSETTPETPATGEDGTPAPTDEGTPATPTSDEGGTPAPADEGSGDEGGVVTPPPPVDLPPPPVELPPTPDYQQGVDTIYGELIDEATAPRWSTQMDNMANAVRVTYGYILPIAYELTGSEALSRRMARDAVASLLLGRATEEIQGAEAAAELEDQPEQPPAEG